MSKIYKILRFVAALAAVWLQSCVYLEPLMSDDEPVTFRVRIESSETVKSSFAGDDSAVNNYKVFIYKSGTLVDSGYWSGGNPLSFTLETGAYDFYVLCNVGDVGSLGTSPESYRYSVGTASAMLAYGIPMAARQAVDVSGGMKSVTLEVERLVARYNLYVRRNFEDVNATFMVTGVRVCQAAADVLAFSGESTPTSVLSGASGDCASADDLSCLNTDMTYDSTTGAVSFYMLENARGTLLPDNTDPWKKCYDTYGGILPSDKSLLCTYLEVTGRWTIPGVSETVTYRMFLGEDNCTNFDVLRNRENNLTLILSDSGKERDSWKVEDVTDFDTRSLAWSKTSMQIYRSGEYYASLSVNPSDMAYDIYYASNPSSPVWQKLVLSASGHTGYTDTTNLVTLDYNLTTRQLTLRASTAASVTKPFAFVVKAQTTDSKVSSSMTVDVASGAKVDYVFRKNWSVSDAKYVYSNCPCVLELAGNASGVVDNTVEIKYVVGYYTSATEFHEEDQNCYYVDTTVVRDYDDSCHGFYFDPVCNCAYYYDSYGTSGVGKIPYIRIYLNGILCEEQEMHSLYSWFVPTGYYKYQSTDFLDQSDCDNPPVLFVEDKEAVELKLYDPVDQEILARTRLLFLPPNFAYNGSSTYCHVKGQGDGWDWQDMQENGITVDEYDNPEDTDLTFTFTKKNGSDGDVSFWELGYNLTGHNACLNIITCTSIPSGGVKEVDITMPVIVDNACAGAFSGQTSVSVDFSSIVSTDPAIGPAAAPGWLKFSDIDSYGYVPSYSSSDPDDPYGLSVGYRYSSATTGELIFRKSFCGDLVLYWDDVTYDSSGKTGYRYKFTFKVRAVFDIGTIYVPVYLAESPYAHFSFNAVFSSESNVSNRGIIRMYPLVKDGTNGAEVFGSLVSQMKMKDYCGNSSSEFTWISFSEEEAELYRALMSASVSVVSIGGVNYVQVEHFNATLSDISGDFDWSQNTTAFGNLWQTYTVSESSGKLAVTSSIKYNYLKSRDYPRDGVYLRLTGSPSFGESSFLNPGKSYEYSNESLHFYFKANVVDEYYNDRFDAWPWNRIVYE